MQRLKLQVLWLEDSLGFAINKIATKGKVVLTPYFFWPISDAWGQIKLELESKSWLPESDRVAVLNSATEVMNCWEQSRTLDTSVKNRNYEGIRLPNVEFVGFS